MQIENMGYRVARKFRHFASKVSFKVSEKIFSTDCPRGFHFKEPRRTRLPYQSISELSAAGKGRRCFLLGTAPTIKDIDISLAYDDYVMVLNRGYELKSRLGRLPDALVISNPYAFNEYGYPALEMDWKHVFLSGSIAHLIKAPSQNLFVFDQWEVPGMEAGFFQMNPHLPLYHSGSVAHAALQIAVSMGFNEIIMAGIDLQFSKTNPHFYKTMSDELKRSQTVSQNNVDRMVAGFEFARNYLAQENGIQILNAGADGTRNPFPHKPWVDVFSSY
jgi:hypothetical protein